MIQTSTEMSANLLHLGTLSPELGRVVLGHGKQHVSLAAHCSDLSYETHRTEVPGIASETDTPTATTVPTSHTYRLLYLTTGLAHVY